MGFEDIKSSEELMRSVDAREAGKSAVRKAEEAISAMELTDEQIDELFEKLRNKRETEAPN